MGSHIGEHKEQPVTVIVGWSTGLKGQRRRNGRYESTKVQSKDVQTDP